MKYYKINISRLLSSVLFIFLISSCNINISSSDSLNPSSDDSSELSSSDNESQSSEQLSSSDNESQSSEQLSSSDNESQSSEQSSQYPEYLYTISYFSNGGTGVMEDQYVNDTSFTLNESKFEMENCLFAGWALNSNDKVPYYLDNETIDYIDSNLSLYAIYKIDESKIGLQAKKYQENLISDLDTYAYYGGSGIHDIYNYIDNFNPLFKDDLEYQFGKVVYIGNNINAYKSITENMISCSQSYVNANNITLLDAYLELAYSYYYQYTQIQYDQGSSYQRKIRDMKPEDATNLYHKYMDCSTFVSNAYYNAFDEVIIKDKSIHSITTKVLIDYAKDNINKNADVILYQDNLVNLTVSEKQNALNKFKENLQPGDLYVYRHGESSSSGAGHVMLYVKDGYFLHSTGASYNYSSLTDRIEQYDNGEGSVRKEKASSTVYNQSSKRYLFYQDSTGADSNDRYAIIRPISNKDIKISNTTLSRCLASGLEIEKKCNNATSVPLNSTLKYSIEITNNSLKPIYNVSCIDNIPSYTSFISISDNYYSSYRDGKILFNIDKIESGETIEVFYEVRVSNDKDDIGKTISSTGIVNNIELNTINLSIGSLSNSELDSIVYMALQYLNNPNVNYSSTNSNHLLDPTSNEVYFSNGTYFVNALYSRYFDSLGKQLNLVEQLSSVTATNFINQIISGSGSSTSIRNDTILSKMLVNGGYGGTYFTSNYDMDRMRLIKYEYLLPGDLILFHNSSATNTYLYLGDVSINNIIYRNTFMIFTTKDGVKILSGEDSDKLIVKFNGYKRFAILRPSLYI